MASTPTRSSWLAATTNPSWFNDNGMSPKFSPDASGTHARKKLGVSASTPSLASPWPKKPLPRPNSRCEGGEEDPLGPSPNRAAAAKARLSQAEARAGKKLADNDTDGNGKLDLKELMQMLGSDSEEEVLELLRALDNDGDGELDVTELAEMRNMMARKRAQDAAAAAEMARLSAERARRAQTASMENLHKNLATHLKQTGLPNAVESPPRGAKPPGFNKQPSTNAAAPSSQPPPGGLMGELGAMMGEPPLPPAAAEPQQAPARVAQAPAEEIEAGAFSDIRPEGGLVGELQTLMDKAEASAPAAAE